MSMDVQREALSPSRAWNTCLEQEKQSVARRVRYFPRRLSPAAQLRVHKLRVETRPNAKPRTHLFLSCSSNDSGKISLWNVIRVQLK